MIRIVFAGTPAFSLPCLKALINADGMDVVGVVSQPDRRAGRGMKLLPSPVKQAALDAGIEVITPERLRGNDEAAAWLRGKAPDVLVVVAFGMLLPIPWLETPGHGAINVHASLLPRWRGAAPIERAMLAGDTETGVGIMRMEEGLDTGPVYAEARLPIADETTIDGLREALAEKGASLLVETLPQIVTGSLQPVPQDEARITYAAKLTAADRLIDWHESASRIDRTVRAFTPKPGARTKLNGKWIKVLRGEALVAGTSGAPGSISMDHDRLDVACGEGCYRIHTLQPEGKRAMDAEDFLRGYAVKSGAAFDAVVTV
ncbi:MAG TPA: methionyl-tRNA formyltransferase [Mariprofundaceae bacterium]|nr:methionyl-tRNA formyltransferase [Mariprofundaceae bacterium]